MTQLIDAGKRLDNLVQYVQGKKPEEQWVLSSALPLFLDAVKSGTTVKEEHLILKKLNSLLDSYEFRYNQVFEVNEYCTACLMEYLMEYEHKLEEAEYRGRKVSLGKPFLTPGGPKKRSVYVKNAKGNVVKVNFGDPNMKIKKSNPKRRKSFRARHKCSNPGPRWKARYWSCRAW
jgi:hypothetical protein